MSRGSEHIWVLIPCLSEGPEAEQELWQMLTVGTAENRVGNPGPLSP